MMYIWGRNDHFVLSHTPRVTLSSCRRNIDVLIFLLPKLYIRIHFGSVKWYTVEVEHARNLQGR